MYSESPGDYEIAQFAIPRSAFAVINTAAIEARALEEGILRPRIEANAKNAGGNKIRLTCRVVMTRRIIEAIAAATSLAERRHDAALVADLSIALAAVLKGREQATSRPRLPMGEQGFIGFDQTQSRHGHSI